MTDNIHTAINAIMQNVGYVKKKKAQGLNYTYAGETALIEAIRPEMVEQNVTMTVLNYDIIADNTYTTSKGTEMQDVKVKANIVFHHAPSGTEITVCALGEGADTSDKATNKAMTGAYKYALRQTFCIETGDDPDKERIDRATRKTAGNNGSHTVSPKSQENSTTGNVAHPGNDEDDFSNVKNKEGVLYSELSIPELSQRFNFYSKYKEPTAEQATKAAAAQYYISVKRNRAEA
jgi:hypothetical protein